MRAGKRAAYIQRVNPFINPSSLWYDVSRCVLDMNVIFTLDNIVVVPIVSRIIAKDYGGMQDKDLMFVSSSTFSLLAV